MCSGVPSETTSSFRASSRDFYRLSEDEKTTTSTYPNFSSLEYSSVVPESTDAEIMKSEGMVHKLKQLIERSEAFHSKHPFPTENNRVSTIAQTKVRVMEVVRHAEDTHPIIHEDVVNLIKSFLLHKCKHGTAKEKELYNGMTPSQFIRRLLHKRPLVFINRLDQYLLRDGTIGEGGFETIGTLAEKEPLTLNKYLSYDEIPISALVGMVVPTHFVNRGWRNNRGQSGEKGWFEEKGVCVGLVGARLEKPGYMEWKHMVITPEQNTKENGYGKNADPSHPKVKNMEMWADFYNCGDDCRRYFPSYEEAASDTSGKYILVDKDTFLNVPVYKKRIRMSIEPFLLEANNQALKNGKKAFVHAVGIGLGVWKLSDLQAQLMLDVYSDIIRERKLPHISNIDFSWFPGDCSKCGPAGNGEYFIKNGNEIKISFSKRNPSQKLKGEDEGKLIVAAYAWDGNSYPGNEYWLGSRYLASSGDPAAACSSMIPELQNPEINSKVSGENTYVYKA